MALGEGKVGTRQGERHPWWFGMSSVESVNGKQGVGRWREGKRQGWFFLEQIPRVSDLFWQELESFPLPGRTGSTSLSQTSTWVAGSSLSLPHPFLSRHERAALLGAVPLIETDPSGYFWELAHPQERGWQQGRACTALLLVSDGLGASVLSQITICRNDECVLEDNSQRTKWKVISPTGNEAMVPSVCFLIPPPNKEAIEMANR